MAMKTRLFILSLFLLPVIANSQQFTDTANTWSVKESSMTFIYHYEGDSVLNEISYQKMYFWTDTTYTLKEFAGLVREEGLKVWYVPPYYPFMLEGLLYDFSLEVGDTVRVISLFCPEGFEIELVCQAMDSIMLETGEHRKRWMFAGWSEEAWVENIGSLFGPVHSLIYHCITDYYVQLLCAHNDDVMLYQEPYYQTCYINTVSIPEVESGFRVQISPNPVRSGSLVKIETAFEIDKLEIFTSQGTHIRLFAGFGRSGILIQTDGLSPGLYFMRISGLSGEIETQKLLIY
jgi:hypothetical protein